LTTSPPSARRSPFERSLPKLPDSDTPYWPHAPESHEGKEREVEVLKENEWDTSKTCSPCGTVIVHLSGRETFKTRGQIVS
jgi:hypothetical protein